jgi:3alpha(or 20beta)-hydroxysteroid dehydrogenase
LVNNAGIGGKTEMIEDSSTENYEKVIAINQTGTYFGIKHVVSSMKKTEAASIINISSASGLAGSKGMLPYVASKFAVRGMAKAAAVELGEFNIRVNSVHPGLIETPLVKQTEESSEEMAKALDVLRQENPLKRGGESEEVSNLVVFLASDESSFMTGAEFVIDGGKFAVQ